MSTKDKVTFVNTGIRKLPWFVKLCAGQVFNRTEIMSIRRTTPSQGKDKVTRNWVVTVSSESAGGPNYTKIWITDEDARRVYATLGIEFDEDPKNSSEKCGDSSETER